MKNKIDKLTKKSKNIHRLIMNKRVLYGLLGGAAVIGAAVAFHLVSKQTDEADENLEEDL